MQRVRQDELQRVVEGMAARGAVVLRGDHGSGRSSLLAALQEVAPSGLVALTRLDVEDPAGALSALAHRAVDPTASPTELVGALAALEGAPVAVDDAQWLGEDPAAWLVPLVGVTPLVVTIATEEPGAAALEAALAGAGAEVLVLEPLRPAEAAGLLTGLGLADAERTARAAFAGGNLGLLHEPVTIAVDSLAPQVADGLVARLAAAGPAGAEVAAALHLAGGAAPAAALDPDGVVVLADAGWVVVEGDDVRLSQGALGVAAQAGLDDDARRGLHRALAGHGPLTVRARHLEAAGLASEAVELATEALGQATLTERPALLELIHRTRGPDAGIAESLASALLAAGRAHDAEAVARTADAPVLLAAALRQRGRAAPALDALARARPDDAAGEARQLARWPGPPGADPLARTAGADGLAPLDDLLAGVAAPSVEGRLLGAAAAAAAAERWDDAGRLATAAVLLGVFDGGPARARPAERAAELLTAAPPGPWRHAVAVARRVLDQHTEGASPALVDAVAALVDLDHPLPGVATAHLALAVSDLGRASDALALLDERATGDRAPLGWDRDVLDWARAEVELAAGRPRRARQVLLRQPAGRNGSPSELLAQLRAGTAGWVALDLGESPPEAAVPLSAPLAAEAEGHRARAHGQLRAAAEAYATAAAAWPSRRAAERARWAAADARWLAGEVDEAVVELRALEAEAEAAGRLPHLARVRRSLRRAGFRTRPTRALAPSAITPDGPGDRLAPGPLAALSPREREVLELVARGLPSGEIAEQLGVGRATIETQVASAMRKLGARTRRHAAAMLVEART